MHDVVLPGFLGTGGRSCKGPGRSAGWGGGGEGGWGPGCRTGAAEGMRAQWPQSRSDLDPWPRRPLPEGGLLSGAAPAASARGWR